MPAGLHGCVVGESAPFFAFKDESFVQLGYAAKDGIVKPRCLCHSHEDLMPHGKHDLVADAEPLCGIVHGLSLNGVGNDRFLDRGGKV